MENASTFRRTRVIAITIVVLAFAMATLNVLPTMRIRADRTSELLNERIRRGLGSEVRLASPGDSSDQVFSATQSVDDFIAYRSGLMMKQETKSRLAEMENATLNGESRRLSVAELAEVLTDTALERFATITDQEIDYATRVLSYERGDYISIPVSTGWSFYAQDFSKLAREARDSVVSNEQEVRSMILPVLSEEIKTRAELFSDATPDQFGDVPDEGVTPLQAILITYSLLTNDYLGGSQDDLRQSISQRPKRYFGKEPRAEKAFGAYGRLSSTPIGLFFNQVTVNRLADRIDERGTTK